MHSFALAPPCSFPLARFCNSEDEVEGEGMQAGGSASGFVGSDSRTELTAAKLAAPEAPNSTAPDPQGPLWSSRSLPSPGEYLFGAAVPHR